MGMIADHFKARLAAMQAQHEQTERDLADLIRISRQSQAQFEAAAAALDAELAD